MMASVLGSVRSLGLRFHAEPFRQFVDVQYVFADQGMQQAKPPVVGEGLEQTHQLGGLACGHRRARLDRRFGRGKILFMEKRWV